MKSIISINNKFMSIDPKRLSEIIASSKYTKGVEIYIDYDNELERKYLEELVYELKRNDLILQIHGNIDMPIDKQIKYLKTIESYANYLDSQIVVTLHTIYDEDANTSINKTVDYLSNVVNKINTNKIIICLENLNDTKELDRLDKNIIEPIILNDEKVYFTYDIGHEIADYGNITDLDKYITEEIRNIHIHSNDGKGNDHMPIYKNDSNWNLLIKALTFLIINNYQYNIVYEYDLYSCYGNTIEEKIKDYLASIDMVSEKYLNI